MSTFQRLPTHLHHPFLNSILIGHNSINFPSFLGDGPSVGDSSSDETMLDDSLPPELQKLVQKALEDIKRESEGAS